MHTIGNIFENFVQKHLATPKVLVQEVKQNPNFKQLLKQYLDAKKLRDDDWVLFNWWIGSTFHTCINELRKLPQ